MGVAPEVGGGCAAADFSFPSDRPEVVSLEDLWAGEHRVCRVVAEVAEGTEEVDPASATQVCAPLTVTSPVAPEVERIDATCPFDGDGNAVAEPNLAPPAAYSTGEMGGRVLYHRADVLGARSPFTAVALYDKGCTIEMYFVSGVGAVARDALDAVLTDVPGAMAERSRRLDYEPLELGGPDVELRTPGQADNSGSVVAQLAIVRLGIDTEVVEGVEAASAMDRPAHVSTSPLPGGPGNSVFYGVDRAWELAPGDRIEVRVGDAVLRYEMIADPVTTSTGALELLGDHGDERITLVAPGNGGATFAAARRVP